MRKMEVEWVKTEEAADILGLSLSGFYSVLREQRRLTKFGENTIRWRMEGREYRFDRATVDLYRDRRA